MVEYTDSVAECPFEVTEGMLEYLLSVFPDRAPGLHEAEATMRQSAGMAKVTRWFQAVHKDQNTPKDPQGNPIEPEPFENEGLISDLDQL